jgi:hypothetical protein
MAKLVVDPEPAAILTPAAKALIGRLPMRQIMRHQTPGTAAPQHILDAIEHLTQRIFTWSASGFFSGQ